MKRVIFLSLLLLLHLNLSCSFKSRFSLGEPMITVWQIDDASVPLTLPLRPGFEYNFIVDWGDGEATSHVLSHNDPKRIHTYAAPGTYTVEIYGLAQSWGNSTAGNPETRLIRVENLGNLGWTNLSTSFQYHPNLTLVRGGNTSQVTDMSYMFLSSPLVQTETRNWNTSNVTNMAGMFDSALNSDPDVSRWDTSKVTNMSRMFNSDLDARFLGNPDVSRWKTSNVTDMSRMFQFAQNANPDVSGWNTSKVTNMTRMFSRAQSANPDVSRWDVSNVTDFSLMFNAMPAATNRIDVSRWDMTSAVNIGAMFNGTTNVNPDPSGWNLPNLLYTTYINGGTNYSAFAGSALSVDNYSSFILRLNATNSLTVSATDNRHYIIIVQNYRNTTEVTTARAELQSRGWRFSDNGGVP